MTALPDIQTSQPLASLRGISKRFPGVIALDRVDFDLYPGEVHGVIGENGAGKSTFVKILAGAEHPDEGTITIKGQPVVIASPFHAQQLGLSFIFQELSVVDTLSVAENITLGQEPRSGPFFDFKSAAEVTGELLGQIGFQDIHPRKQVGSLSVAQKQSVMIARALNLEADIIVMDEPTSSLDEDEVEKLFAVIDRLRREGKGIIFISHRMREIESITDRVTVFKDGKRVTTCDTVATTSQEMVHLMVGRTVNHMFPEKNRQAGEVVLKAENLQNDRLKNVSLELHRGEILAIAGLIGAGRTELLRALFGADPLSGGQISLNSRPLNLNSPRDAILAGICRVPEDRRSAGIIPRQSVQDNLLMVWSQFARARRIQTDARTTAQTLVDNLRIKTPTLEQLIAYLSGGNQQKVVVGKWLAMNTEVLLLDEPTRGIDVGAKVEMYDLIDRLAHDGLAIIFVSSELPEVLGMADRILVMREGRVVGELNGSATEQDVATLSMLSED
jgi:ribose transport system ATP-binding protein